jgi:hypothetical protein
VLFGLLWINIQNSRWPLVTTFVSLAMLALAVATVIAAQSRPATPLDPLSDT